MAVLKLRGVEVNFPFEPYGCQIDYMEKVIQCLQEVSLLLYFVVENLEWPCYSFLSILSYKTFMCSQHRATRTNVLSVFSVMYPHQVTDIKSCQMQSCGIDQNKIILSALASQ